MNKIVKIRKVIMKIIEVWIEILQNLILISWKIKIRFMLNKKWSQMLDKVDLLEIETEWGQLKLRLVKFKRYL